MRYEGKVIDLISGIDKKIRKWHGRTEITEEQNIQLEKEVEHAHKLGQLILILHEVESAYQWAIWDRYKIPHEAEDALINCLKTLNSALEKLLNHVQ